MGASITYSIISQSSLITPSRLNSTTFRRSERPLSGELNSESDVLSPSQAVELNVLLNNRLSGARVVNLDQDEAVDTVGSGWATNSDKLPLPEDMGAVVEDSERVDYWDGWCGEGVVDVCCAIWFDEGSELEWVVRDGAC